MTDLHTLRHPPAPAELDPVSRAVATPLLLLQADAPDFHIVDANEALLAVVDTCREDLVGCGYFERFFPDPAHLDEATAATGRSMRTSFDLVLATREPDVMPVQRYDLPRPDGTPEERYWRPTNTPIFEADGRLSRLAQHLQDVTSVVLLARAGEAAEARARAEARLRHVFEQAPIAYAVLRGPEHRFETANPRFQEMIGSRPVLGRLIREALPELAGAGFSELLDRVFATGQAHYAHEYHLRVDPGSAARRG
jgi:PAS domain-containing protein